MRVFKPHPGIAIILPLEEKEDLVTSNREKGRIRLGKIVAMGGDYATPFGAILEAKDYGKVGDKVYFMHYYDEGGVDYGVIDHEKVFFVKFDDLRAKV